MKNKLLKLSEGWTINRDEFYEIDPLDKSIDPDFLFSNLYIQEDLLSISKSDYHMDLGWYGEEEDGCFCLYLYRGNDWNKCELLEKVQTNRFSEITERINSISEKVDNGSYSALENKIASIDNYSDIEQFSILNHQ
ncbi:hypothetical protein [Rufibacter sp. LB8]|uniref:hypothetical protein n=1 Tax=Rufibacter sp. LB8 TaxID=2777781 RepID=UPI00178C2837|nr:hypothetical protein [Rufibacter sp. LB8]